MSKLTYLQISFKNSLYLRRAFFHIHPNVHHRLAIFVVETTIQANVAHRDTEFEGGASPSDDGLKASRSYPRSVITSRASAPVRRKPVPRRVKESLPDRAPCHRRRLNAIETSRGQIMGTRRESLHAERACCAPAGEKRIVARPRREKTKSLEFSIRSAERLQLRTILITFDSFEPCKI